MNQGQRLSFRQEELSYRIVHPWSKEGISSMRETTVYFHGSARSAKNPPWEVGVVWADDAIGDDRVGVACQEIGASVWGPCNDHQSDEPQEDIDVCITVPK